MRGDILDNINNTGHVGDVLSPEVLAALTARLATQFCSRYRGSLRSEGEQFPSFYCDRSQSKQLSLWKLVVHSTTQKPLPTQHHGHLPSAPAEGLAATAVFQLRDRDARLDNVVHLMYRFHSMDVDGKQIQDALPLKVVGNVNCARQFPSTASQRPLVFLSLTVFSRRSDMAAATEAHRKLPPRWRSLTKTAKQKKKLSRRPPVASEVRGPR